MYRIIEIKDNKVVRGLEENRAMYEAAGDGIYISQLLYISQPKNIREYRELYFTLIDLVVSEGETGYRKKELHRLLKDARGIISTKGFDIEDWAAYLPFVKEYIRENLNFYL